jgi:predicted transcriptional regulator
MKGRARVLDSRYMEFIEYLKKFGEHQNVTRMIHRLSNPEYDAVETVNIGLVMEMGGADKMIYSFWQKGWIEIREMEKKRKNGATKSTHSRSGWKILSTILLKRGGKDLPGPNHPSRCKGFRC